MIICSVLPLAAQCGIYAIEDEYWDNSNATLTVSVTAQCPQSFTYAGAHVRMPSGAQDDETGNGTQFAQAVAHVSSAAAETGYVHFWAEEETELQCWENSQEWFYFDHWHRLNDLTPNIATTAPTSFSAGSSFTLHIYGSGFGTHALVTISDPSGSVSYSQPLSNSPGQIDVPVAVAAVAPAESVTVTVTSRGFDGSGFLSNGGNSSTSPSINIPISPIPAPAPRILFGGNDVTGRPQSVAVGEQVAFNSSKDLPSGLVATSEGWTIQGTFVGGYVIDPIYDSATVLVPTVTSNFTTIYWVYPGQNLQVQYSYCMNNNQCNQATTTFNVSGPSGGTMTPTPYSGMTLKYFVPCHGNPSGNYMVYGDIAVSGSPCKVTGTPGISFITSGYSGDSGGKYVFVHLINTDNYKACNSYPGIDGRYPYQVNDDVFGPRVTDSPSNLLLSTDRSVTRSFNATMYVMWQSNALNSIPVPLGYQTWGFSGTATCTSSCDLISNWTATANGIPGPFGGFVQSTPQQNFSGFPTWSSQSVCR